MNMVEKVARAIAADEGAYDADEMLDLAADATVEGYTDIVPFWVLFASKARAAIEAMREPTEEMKKEGAAKIRNFTAVKSEYPRTTATWQAMIDAALED